MSQRLLGILGVGIVTFGAALQPEDAQACGGFFCSQAQPVNQAAERIVFAKNDDGTVTAVIEIKYEGPAESFSWLLPISSVPKGDQIAVASNLAFERLQQATNPQYNLVTRVEGNCDQELERDGFASSSGSGGESLGEGGAASVDDGVTVEASGVVGAFEWAAISVDRSLPHLADAAVNWLSDNGYDVPAGSRGLLAPYLDEGMYLLALRLKKGALAGSIRPIVLTYEASKPMIPVKLTAVAANDDMGVLAWVLSDAQAVPMNYYALELNEARLNWFNASSNYNDVVIAAADEAGGQGFVTEYAQASARLSDAVWSAGEEAEWRRFQLRPSAGTELVLDAMDGYSQWDGFWEVVRQHVTLPTGVTLEEVQSCPDCFYTDFEVDAPTFLARLEADVIQPARVVQQLIDAHPEVTRLYTTLSAAEMTVDPLFTFNSNLPAVDNLHTADRIIECGAGYYQFEANWRIELPQGGVVRGGPDDVGTWPATFNSQPANRRILRQGESGSGKVLEDNSFEIEESVATYSDSIPSPPRRPTVPPRGHGPITRTPGAPTRLTPDGELTPAGGTGGGGCSMSGKNIPHGFALALLGLAAFSWRRRR